MRAGEKKGVSDLSIFQRRPPRPSGQAHGRDVEPATYMVKKQSHCTPSCTTPSRPAKQANPLISRQHETSTAVLGKQRMLTNAEVPDVVPNRTNHGDIPKEVPREMIRICCGRYEIRIPMIMILPAPPEQSIRYMRLVPGAMLRPER